ncbi:MAG: spermidine/putrescine ABC transporter substrate-binding protein [Ruminococcus sp.]|nr:spermidine/putrescine ABC transporter substrate-binding protein [Ruminococcus sp.]MBQ7134498.1 spermidine/putrescine ABC transporter substrate-binding protein [Ruminococcus sp.]
MKKIICVLLCLVIAAFPLCLSGCGSSGGYEGEINVYNWGEYISNGDDDTLDVIEEFEKRYNIKVNYTNFETNEELYNILSNSNSSYDVIIPSDYMVSKLREEGMLEKIDFENIPNYKYIMDRYKTSSYDPTGEYSIAYTTCVVALGYNAKVLGHDDVTGFKDLWDEKNAGKILMFNNSRDAMAISMQLCDPKINPGAETFTRDDIDRATEKLVSQKPLLKKYVMDQVFTEMEGSQAGIAPYYAGDIYTMMDNNPDLDYCLPEEGSNLFVDAMCIPTCCQNKEYAEIFINFMCDPEIALANAEYIGYGTPNSGAYEMLDEEVRNCELIYPPEEYLNKCYTFSNIPSDVYVYMQEKFVKACSSSAEITDMGEEDNSSDIIYTIIVCILLAVIIIATITMLTMNIVRAVKNRGRIHKL